MAADFDYTRIPVGYYDRIFRGEPGIRRLWHVSKFERVRACLPAQAGGALLDVGCFAGTFLSTLPERQFGVQVGIDILPAQIDYATRTHARPFRSFRSAATRELASEPQRFDAVTLVEVLEHLRPATARAMLDDVYALLAPGGTLVLTTPNYASAWPLLELALEHFSDVTYQEQHLTRFSYLRFEAQLEAIEPAIWQRFACTTKTTTHFLTPLLAALSYELAYRLSRVVPHRLWRHPFGNLILAVLTKR